MRTTVFESEHFRTLFVYAGKQIEEWIFTTFELNGLKPFILKKKATIPRDQGMEISNKKMIGLVLIEIWYGFKKRMVKLSESKELNLQNIYNAFLESIPVGVQNAISKYKDAFVLIANSYAVKFIEFIGKYFNVNDIKSETATSLGFKEIIISTIRILFSSDPAMTGAAATNDDYRESDQRRE